ncbi:DUF5412 family protein [Clostridium botulinum]|uniref:DUF5412 family protein n=1 Tax=Clostridium botulinum TaxID=1491 RepID=UPI001E541E7F|nr:DUF5412 family protein [Clostridium botulinum]
MTKYRITIITFLLIYICFMLTSCGDICGNKIIKTINNYNNKYVVIGFIRDGGATTAFSPQVSILKKGEKFKDSTSGNVFIGNKSDYIDIEWKNETTLLIKYKCSEEDVMKKETKFKNINIEYQKLQDYYINNPSVSQIINTKHSNMKVPLI